MRINCTAGSGALRGGCRVPPEAGAWPESTDAFWPERAGLIDGGGTDADGGESIGAARTESTVETGVESLLISPACDAA